jgi:hypothetical protein
VVSLAAASHTPRAAARHVDPLTLCRSRLLAAHTGTHVDAPYHFIDKGDGIETLDLDVLIGEQGGTARGCSRTAASSDRQDAALCIAHMHTVGDRSRAPSCETRCGAVYLLQARRWWWTSQLAPTSQVRRACAGHSAQSSISVMLVTVVGGGPCPSSHTCLPLLLVHR